MKQRANRAGTLSLANDVDDAERDRAAPGASAYRTGASGGAARAAGEAYHRLTGRERWIVSQLVKHKGAPNKAIAYALDISPHTLRNHLASIYAKLGVRRRLELVLYAMERDLDGLPDE